MRDGNRPAALLLGLDPYVLRACERLGVDAVVAVGAAARDFGLHRVPDWAQTLIVDDQASAESVLSALARDQRLRERIAFVQSTDERALVCAAVVAQSLHVPGPEVETMLRFRDKWLQKRLIRDAGIHVARTQLIEDIHTVDVSSLDGFDRAVLKPVAGAGTRLTTAIDGHEELTRAIDSTRAAAGQTRTFLIEEFVSGQELTADGVIAGGELAFVGLGAYEQPCLATVASQRPVQMYKLDPHAHAGAYELVTPTVRAALDALGLRDGVFHMELFRNAETGVVSFSECAARRGGGLTQEEIHHKFSVDLGEAALRLAAGGPPELCVSLTPGVVGTTFLPQRDGILLGCPSAEQVVDRPSVEYARIELPIGFRMQGSVTDTIGRVGQAMLRADTAAELLAASTELLDWFSEQLVVLPNTFSVSELRDRQRELVSR